MQLRKNACGRGTRDESLRESAGEAIFILGHLISRASLHGARTQHKTKTLTRQTIKLPKQHVPQPDCLRWRFSLILNSLNVSTCVSRNGVVSSSAVYSEAPLILNRL